jgi:HEAT repeat protein
MASIFLVDAIMVIVAAVWEFVTAVIEEVSGPFKRWMQVRLGLVDPEQSPAVRKWALKLTSRRRPARVEAAERIGHLNDRSAVPSLLRAVARYKDDGPFLEVVVHSLTQLGDERALSTLRRLSSGRHQSLMQAARNAVASIEPGVTLLRNADGPRAAAQGLLRPVSAEKATFPSQLLRASAPATDTLS